MKEEKTKLGQGLLKGLKEVAAFESGAGDLRATHVEGSHVFVDSLLRGIGCNMMAEPPLNTSPEECLVDLSPVLLQDPKALVLTIGAVTVHAQVFSPDSILKAMQTRKCDFNVIGALMTKASEERFRKVIEFCRAQKFLSAIPATTLTLALKIGQAGGDQEFQSFGIDIAQLEPVDGKKITKPEFFRK